MDNKKINLLAWCLKNDKIGQQLIKEWDTGRNESMTLYKPGSAKKVYWKCPICGKTYKKTIRDRVNGSLHGPCGKKIGREKLRQWHRDNIKFEDSISFLYPELIKEWDFEANSKEGLSPRYVTKSSQKMIHWRCSNCNNTYIMRASMRTKGYGCKECRKKRKQVDRG